MLGPLHPSVDRRFRVWKDVALDSLACNWEDHPVTRQK